MIDSTVMYSHTGIPCVGTGMCSLSEMWYCCSILWRVRVAAFIFWKGQFFSSGRYNDRVEEREKSSICCFFPPMVTTDGVGPDQSQESGIPLGSFTCVTGSLVVEPSFTAFAVMFIGIWMQSTAAQILVALG